MLFIAAFGLLMMVLSAIMVVNPRGFANGIVTFSRHPWFHPFEVVSRLLAGGLFVLYAHQTLYPEGFKWAGYLLVAVGLGLLCTPPKRHRQYALWSARRFKPWFRYVGLPAMALGAFIVYCSIS